MCVELFKLAARYRMAKIAVVVWGLQLWFASVAWLWQRYEVDG